MTRARTLMVQGTTSSAGKSLLVTALCRIFRQEGLRVAPFKAQNMALNAAVTADGLEIGRAQAVQAEAAGITATVDMNPILLKPEGNARAQVVVMGKAMGAVAAGDYAAHAGELRQVIDASLARLREQHDLVIIEGAGSPVEVNLRARDLANMHVARAADAPVLLVGDIDRGGLFAAYVGTLELLEPDERARVAAFVVNKFRGDVALLQPGLDFLTARTGIPVLGVVPFIPALRIADEDVLGLDQPTRLGRRATTGEVDVAIVKLPRISNYDEFAPLEHEPGVVVRFVDEAAALPGADLVVVPGSKTTVIDLRWLRETGIAAALVARARAGHPILAICGGCQMLGERVDDPDGVESAEASVTGLGLLPLRTIFRREKTTARVRAHARAAGPALFGAVAAAGDVPALDGYEIHAGEVERTDGSRPAFELVERNGRPARVADGAVRGSVVGTLIHGLLENDALRAALLDGLRARRGLAVGADARPVPTRDAEYDRLAAAVRASVDWPLLRRLAG